MSRENLRQRAGGWLGRKLAHLRRLLRQFSKGRGWRTRVKLRSDAPISCSEIGGASVVQIPLVSPDRKELEAKPAWITEKEFQRANAEINRSISRSEVERLGRTAEDGVESDALVLDEMSGEVSFLVARRNSHPR